MIKNSSISFQIKNSLSEKFTSNRNRDSKFILKRQLPKLKKTKPGSELKRNKNKSVLINENPFKKFSKKSLITKKNESKLHNNYHSRYSYKNVHNETGEQKKKSEMLNIITKYFYKNLEFVVNNKDSKIKKRKMEENKINTKNVKKDDFIKIPSIRTNNSNSRRYSNFELSQKENIYNTKILQILKDNDNECWKSDTNRTIDRFNKKLKGEKKRKKKYSESNRYLFNTVNKLIIIQKLINIGHPKNISKTLISDTNYLTNFCDFDHNKLENKIQKKIASNPVLSVHFFKCVKIFPKIMNKYFEDEITMVKDNLKHKNIKTQFILKPHKKNISFIQMENNLDIKINKKKRNKKQNTSLDVIGSEKKIHLPPNFSQVFKKKERISKWMLMINMCLKTNKLSNVSRLGYYFTKIRNFQKEIDFLISYKDKDEFFYSNYMLYKIANDLKNNK